MSLENQIFIYGQEIINFKQKAYCRNPKYERFGLGKINLLLRLAKLLGGAPEILPNLPKMT